MVTDISGQAAPVVKVIRDPSVYRPTVVASRGAWPHRRSSAGGDEVMGVDRDTSH